MWPQNIDFFLVTNASHHIFLGSISKKEKESQVALTNWEYFYKEKNKKQKNIWFIKDRFRKKVTLFMLIILFKKKYISSGWLLKYTSGIYYWPSSKIKIKMKIYFLCWEKKYVGTRIRHVFSSLICIEKHPLTEPCQRLKNCFFHHHQQLQLGFSGEGGRT